MKKAVNNQHLCKKLFFYVFVYYFIYLFSSESYVKLSISTKYLEKEKREVIEEILTKEVQDYLKFHDYSGDNHGRAMKSFTEHLINVYCVHLVTVDVRCVIIILDCPTLDSLEHLWNDYLAAWSSRWNAKQ